MTIRGFLKYREKPVAFFPVYIGYEKLMESKAYQAELSGEEKKSETFLNSIRSILRIRGRYGKVHVNFSTPVFLGQVLDTEAPSWMAEPYDDQNRPLWLHGVTDTVAEKVMQRINEGATVNAINLISAVLLSTRNQSMDETELSQSLEFCQRLIASLNYSTRLELTARTGREQIEHALHLKMVRRRKHELGDIIYTGGSRASSMTYYRNNILHLLALPSAIACCFNDRRTMSGADIRALIFLVYPFLQRELFLTWQMDELPDTVDRILDTLCREGVLRYNEVQGLYSRPATSGTGHELLDRLARILLPVLEVYYLTLALLSKAGSETIPRRALHHQCQLMAQRISIIHELNSPDYSDIHLIANFVDALITMDYVTVYGAENLRYSDVFERTDRRIRLLLGRNMRTRILQMIKQAPTPEFGS